MKRLFLPLLCIVCVAFISWKVSQTNPLQGTAWKGSLNVPDPVNAYLEFSADKFEISIDGNVVETMSYKVNGDTLFVNKLSGNSSCGDEVGKYIFKVKDNVALFTATDDNCVQRKEAFSQEGYIKVK